MLKFEYWTSVDIFLFKSFSFLFMKNISLRFAKNITLKIIFENHFWNITSNFENEASWSMICLINFAPASGQKERKNKRSFSKRNCLHFFPINLIQQRFNPTFYQWRLPFFPPLLRDGAERCLHWYSQVAVVSGAVAAPLLSKTVFNTNTQ